MMLYDSRPGAKIFIFFLPDSGSGKMSQNYGEYLYKTELTLWKRDAIGITMASGWRVGNI